MENVVVSIKHQKKMAEPIIVKAANPTSPQDIINFVLGPTVIGTTPSGNKQPVYIFPDAKAEVKSFSKEQSRSQFMAKYIAKQKKFPAEKYGEMVQIPKSKAVAFLIPVHLDDAMSKYLASIGAVLVENASVAAAPAADTKTAAPVAAAPVAATPVAGAGTPAALPVAAAPVAAAPVAGAGTPAALPVAAAPVAGAGTPAALPVAAAPVAAAPVAAAPVAGAPVAGAPVAAAPFDLDTFINSGLQSDVKDWTLEDIPAAITPVFLFDDSKSPISYRMYPTRAAFQKAHGVTIPKSKFGTALHIPASSAVAYVIPASLKDALISELAVNSIVDATPAAGAPVAPVAGAVPVAAAPVAAAPVAAAPVAPAALPSLFTAEKVQPDDPRNIKAILGQIPQARLTLQQIEQYNSTLQGEPIEVQRADMKISMEKFMDNDLRDNIYSSKNFYNSLKEPDNPLYVLDKIADAQRFDNPPIISPYKLSNFQRASVSTIKKAFDIAKAYDKRVKAQFYNLNDHKQGEFEYYGPRDFVTDPFERVDPQVKEALEVDELYNLMKWH